MKFFFSPLLLLAACSGAPFTVLEAALPLATPEASVSDSASASVPENSPLSADAGADSATVVEASLSEAVLGSPCSAANGVSVCEKNNRFGLAMCSHGVWADTGVTCGGNEICLPPGVCGIDPDLPPTTPPDGGFYSYADDAGFIQPGSDGRLGNCCIWGTTQDNCPRSAYMVYTDAGLYIPKYGLVNDASAIPIVCGGPNEFGYPPSTCVAGTVCSIPDSVQ